MARTFEQLRAEAERMANTNPDEKDLLDPIFSTVAYTVDNPDILVLSTVTRHPTAPDTLTMHRVLMSPDDAMGLAEAIMGAVHEVLHRKNAGVQ